MNVIDVMQTDVVSVRPDTPVRRLARMLADAEISGCPVLDDEGALVGVVSATDVVRLAANTADVHLANARLATAHASLDDVEEGEDDATVADGFYLPEDTPFFGDRPLADLLEDELDQLAVRDIMTPVTFTVRPDMSLPELAQFLVRGRIHRAVVVEGENLLGIVTSQDVLAALADGRLAVR